MYAKRIYFYLSHNKILFCSSLIAGCFGSFAQIEPRVVFSVDAVVYNGKVHDHMTKLEEVVKGIPMLYSCRKCARGNWLSKLKQVTFFDNTDVS